MDILDIMDLLDVGHPLLNNTDSSSLLDDSFTMDNLSHPDARNAEADAVTTNETSAVTQSFAERNLELKLPVLSSSSSDSEPEHPTNTTAGTSVGTEGERVASPPPNCAICLGRCKNKCFTDSCMHQFCFKCLCEWSKVKPECPLCKQTFKSIIHNVKSIHQFEEYHVQPPTVQIAHPDSPSIFDVFYPGRNRIQTWNGSTIRPYYLGAAPFSSASNGVSLPTASGSSSNRSAVTSANGSGLRNQYVYRGELLDLYRQEYPGAIANSGTLSQLWRRYVYDRKLYALPVADITGRFRESSGRFYRDNPSQIHRLMPWINRDIVCLLRQSQHDVTTVLESINAALTLMNILSPAFRRRLQPFLGNKTAHFIHELNNFARSPYDMVGYDRAVQYSPQTNNQEIVIEFSSSDESTDTEQIDVARESGNSTAIFSRRSRSTNSSSTNGGIFENDDVGPHHRAFNSYLNPFTAINLTIHNRLTSASASVGDNRGPGISVGNALGDIQDDVSLVIDLRGESDNNETTSTAQATNNSSNYLNGQNAGTSESDIITTGPQPSVSENIELTSGSSDECEFVLERKPPHLRTPEMVSLDSASDSDVVFVEESKPLNKSSFSSSEEEINNETNDHHKHSRRQSKIAALVQAKKRNQSANLVKSEQQDCHAEVYNLGASTSAALRLSLQKRAEKSQGSQAGTSSKTPTRDKYSLRKNDVKARSERKENKRRGKRLDSESSHSNTSSSSTTNSSATTNTSYSKSLSSSSDEDYVLAFNRRKVSSAGGGELRSLKRGRKIRKSSKRKTSKNSNRKTAQNDSRKRKHNVYSSVDDDDDDEEENGLRGKNFALVLAINERRKRQDKKNSFKDENDDQEEESEGENSWRVKAVNDILKKQQLQKAKSSHKTNERKRLRKTSTPPNENRKTRKLQKYESPNQQENKIKKSKEFRNSEGTSSDESDNINLIQLKTKLTGQDYQKDTNMEQNNINEVTDKTATNLHTETTAQTVNIRESDNSATSTISSTANVFTTPANASTSEYTTIPADVAANIEEDYCSISNIENSLAAPTNDDTTVETRHIETITTQHQEQLFNFSDDSSNFNNQNNPQPDTIDNNNQDSADQNVEQQNLHSSSSQNCYNNQENPHQLQKENADNADHDDSYNAAAANNDYCDDDDTMSNVPTTMNLNESNVFADATSMSTTTTDTILHEAAEQISSAAVNFYNPQQSFNTADFADENSTNSTSSISTVSSVSSITTSTTTSSSSSTNSYNYNKYVQS